MAAIARPDRARQPRSTPSSRCARARSRWPRRAPPRGAGARVAARRPDGGQGPGRDRGHPLDPRLAHLRRPRAGVGRPARRPAARRRGDPDRQDQRAGVRPRVAQLQPGLRRPPATPTTSPAAPGAPAAARRRRWRRGWWRSRTDRTSWDRCGTRRPSATSTACAPASGGFRRAGGRRLPAPVRHRRPDGAHGARPGAAARHARRARPARSARPAARMPPSPPASPPTSGAGASAGSATGAGTTRCSPASSRSARRRSAPSPASGWRSSRCPRLRPRRGCGRPGWCCAASPSPARLGLAGRRPAKRPCSSPRRSGRWRAPPA